PEPGGVDPRDPEWRLRSGRGGQGRERGGGCHEGDRRDWQAPHMLLTVVRVSPAFHRSRHMTEIVQSERHGAVSLLRLNRPEALNALSDDVLAALCAALDATEESGDVRSVVLCGAGRAFAAGADVAGLRELEPGEVLTGERGARWQRLRSSRLPVIAAVHGWCLGGGCELALTCDIVLAAE